MNGSVRLGRYLDDGTQECHYDIPNSSNFNIGLVGMSGAGKTYTIIQLINAYARMESDVGPVTTFVFDLQGDLGDIEGIPQNKIHNFKFAYSQGNGSINPLRVDPLGGVFIAVRNFTETAKMFNHSLGTRQVADLNLILNELYADFGFDKDDSKTWKNPSPNLLSLLDYVESLIMEVKSGVKQDVYVSASDMLGSTGLYEADINTKEGQAELADFGQRILDLVKARKTGKRKVEWNESRLESLKHTIVNMKDSGLFSGDDVEPQIGMVNRFDLVDLQVKDMLTVIHLLLDRIFNYVQRRKWPFHPKVPRMMIVLDEGKLAKAISKHDLSPLNRIGTEARKYGLGAVLGVQSPDQITDDVRRNCALFMIYPIHPSEYSQAKTKYGLEANQIKRLKAKSDALVYMNTGVFRPVKLFGE